MPLLWTLIVVAEVAIVGIPAVYMEAYPKLWSAGQITVSCWQLIRWHSGISMVPAVKQRP